MTRVGVRGPLSLHIAAHRKAWQEGFTVVPLGPSSASPGTDVVVGDFVELAELEAEPAKDDVHCVVSTSGTSRKVTQIEIPRPVLEAHRGAAIQRLGCGPESVWSAGLHPWRIGAIALIDRCLHGGGEIRADAGPADEGVTHASVVPTTLVRWLREDAKPPSTLQCLLVGGDRLRPEIAKQALEAGWPVYATYGLTETCSQVATATPEELAAHPGTVGHPLDGVEVSIVDGEIIVEGPTVVGGSIATGDLGHMEDGRLYVTGRKDDRIISGGVNVDPVEVEEILLQCPGVEEAAVGGRPDEEWGKRPVAFIVGEAEPDKVMAWAKKRLEPAQVPIEVRHVMRLPRNDQGKLVRKRLPVQEVVPE